MLKIAICGNSGEDLKRLQSHIESVRSNTIRFTVYTFANGDALIERHSKEPFDIIFIEADMPFLNGIEVAQKIREFDESVKFVVFSNSKEYAFDAYRIKASDYLLKPLQNSEIIMCLTELLHELEHSQQYIMVKSARSVMKVAVQAIEYVEAQNRHTLFCMRDGTIISSIQPFHIYHDILTPMNGFFMCHRSYIVNLFHVDTFTSQEIKMQSGALIPISRNNSKAFKDIYFSVLMGK